MMTFLRWLGQRTTDALAGAVVAAGAVALFALTWITISVLAEAPAWAHWLFLSLAALMVLAVVGRTWRASMGPPPRTQVPVAVHAPTRTVWDDITDSNRRRSEQWLRDNFGPAAAEEPLKRRRSPLDERMAAKTDDELQAQGVDNPAAMRCMGFNRYCEAAARRELAVEARALLVPCDLLSASGFPQVDGGRCAMCGKRIDLVAGIIGPRWVHRVHPSDGHAPVLAVVEGVPWWKCPNCAEFTQISHQSTFCKRVGQSAVTVHWCCPDACELDALTPFDGDDRGCRCGIVASPPRFNCEHGLTDPDDPRGGTR